jgi:alpha-L-fucosidase
MMHRRTLFAATALLSLPRPWRALLPRPTPSPAQLRWQRDERALFVHFTVNTFTGREWGDGTESPQLFNPAALDPRQWTGIARSAGFRTVILTAKHHDGFCLWPSKLTSHTVAASPWKQGRGDVVRELADACRRDGLGLGLYLSPWDRHEPSYGDSPRYNDFYIAQLTELLSWYGPVTEVWFDGANGEGPNGKRQVYDWPRIHRTVRALQPEAVIFSDAGPDIRWIGNEKGSAGEPNWASVDPDTVPVPGLSGDDVIRQLQHGDADGSIWRPGEADVSIRPGWFWHPEEDEQVKPAAELLDLYYQSVGRNAGLLLNVPPTASGRFHENDVRQLDEFGRLVRDEFARDEARDATASTSTEHRRHRAAHVLEDDPDTYWMPAHGTTGSVELELGRAVPIRVIDLREAIQFGQHIARYRVEVRVHGKWQVAVRGTTIGNRWLHRVTPTTADAIRLTIEESFDVPRVARVGLFGSPP